MGSFVRDFTVSEVETGFVGHISDCNRCFSMRVGGLRVFHTNIRSVSRNFDELRVFLGQFDIPFDIIILTETFILDDIGPYQMAGYNAVYSGGSFNSHEGVLVYVENTIKYEYRVIKLGELRTVQIVFWLSHRKICLTAIYIDSTQHVPRNLIKTCTII